MPWHLCRCMRNSLCFFGETGGCWRQTALLLGRQRATMTAMRPEWHLRRTAHHTFYCCRLFRAMS